MHYTRKDIILRSFLLVLGNADILYWVSVMNTGSYNISK